MAGDCTRKPGMKEIKDLECLFLQRRFRTVLSKSNQLLRHAAGTASLNSSSLCQANSNKTIYHCLSNLNQKSLGFGTPNYFFLVMKDEISSSNRTIDSLLQNQQKDEHNHADNNLIQIAGSLALQSWYEIWKPRGENLAPKDAKRQAFRHLKPFMDYFACSSGCSKAGRGAPMGIALACMLVELLLLATEGETYHWAVEFTAEMLFVLSSVSSTSEGHYDKDERKESVFRLLFLRLLPYSKSESHVQELLVRLDDDAGSTWRTNTTYEWNCSLEMERESVLTLLEYLKGDRIGGTFGLSSILLVKYQTYLENCLPQKDTKMEPSIQQNLTQRQNISAHHQPTTGTTNTIMFVLRDVILKGLLNLRRAAQHIILHGTPQERSILSFSLLTTLIAWRQRQVILEVPKTVTRLAFQVIQEIITALLPPAPG